jgi:nucleoside-diphosphate-sugar epimerase
MRILFIGGTGNISEAVSKLVVSKGHELFLLNRGLTQHTISGAQIIQADIHSFSSVEASIKQMSFDVVADFIAFTPDDVKRDIQLFQKITKQYVFVSSAVVYEKNRILTPIRECSPHANPNWDYAVKKIECERILMNAWENEHFPVTIVRPSHTYDKMIPVAIGKGYDLIDRMRKGNRVIIHDSGNNLWTMTHSSDFAKGFVGLLGNPVTIGEAFHITSDEHLSWNQIYRIIADAAGVSDFDAVHIPGEFIQRLEPEWGPTITCDKGFSAIFDNSKIKRYVPSFECTIPFYEGFHNTLSRYDNGELSKEIDSAVSHKLDNIIQTWIEFVNQAEAAYRLMK